jgi:glycosyltransferase involved in cell wall biosynthesis
MSKKNPKVLVVATSRKTRGGITAVIKTYEKMEVWKKFHIKWLGTHRDKNDFIKILYFLCSFFAFLLIAPFYDIVHIHLSEPSSAKRKRFYFKVAKFYRKKIVLHFHAFSPETTLNSKYQPLYKELFSQADLVIVLSNQWKQWTEQYLAISNNVVIVYNPCDVIMLNDNDIRQKIVLFAGTLNQRKGYADLLRAFALIAQTFPAWTLTFAGNGEIEEARKLTKELNIERQVVFLGWINGEQKDRVFREASIFCLPSYAEGFPMAVLDAWAYGISVITTPVGGLPDIVENKKNALIFEAGDIEQLSKQLEEMISNDNLRSSIAKESLILVKKKFSLQIINQQLENIYQSLCKK